MSTLRSRWRSAGSCCQCGQWTVMVPDYEKWTYGCPWGDEWVPNESLTPPHQQEGSEQVHDWQDLQCTTRHWVSNKPMPRRLPHFLAVEDATRQLLCWPTPHLGRIQKCQEAPQEKVAMCSSNDCDSQIPRSPEKVDESLLLLDIWLKQQLLDSALPGLAACPGLASPLGMAAFTML